MNTKRDFLEHKLIPVLNQVPSDTAPHWGKMNFQQMVEHLSDVMRIASGKTAFPRILTPEENLAGMRSFMMSDKPFRQNTPNPLLSETPGPVRNATIDQAISELEQELKYLFKVFDENNHTVTRNPFFGDLNYEENIQLLYKHAWHHLKQFGVAEQ